MRTVHPRIRIGCAGLNAKRRHRQVHEPVLFAPIVAFAAARGLRGSKGLVLAWDLLGLAGLLVAVTTGFLSSPSPLQAFAFSNPNTLITAFPLVMIPVFEVPLAVLLDFASLARLERTEASHHLAASVAL